MSNLLIGIGAIGVAGCASVAPPAVQQRAEEIHQRPAEMDAAVKRIVEVSGPTIPGHPNYTVLGPVSGYCGGSPEANQEVIAGDSVGGTKIWESGWPIINSNAANVAIGGGTGYRECMGTGVSFTPAANAPSPQWQG